MTTLKDIAKLAGVSTVTVSNVINGYYKKVLAENITKIKDIIDKLNYVPNATARSLAMKESKLIGVVIPNITEQTNMLQSPYNSEILGVLEGIIRMSGYYLLVRCVDDCKEIIPIINTWHVDGVIFLGAFCSDVIELKKSLKLPMVFIDTYEEGEAIANVGTEDFKGGYIATKYLINNGHKHICFVGPDITIPGVIKERYEGYRKAMTESGYEAFMKSRFIQNTTYDCGLTVGKDLAFEDDSITAVFATADILALGLMEGYKVSGKRIPDDVSVIGFDNLPECRYSTPKLTTINQNISQKAERAATLLFNFINNKHISPANEVVPVDLVERQSVRSIIT